MIASGFAVELFASLLQHPVKALAPANISTIDVKQYKGNRARHENDSNHLDTESLLGCIPHQVRGFIYRLDQITPCYREFNYCTACSFTVSLMVCLFFY